LQASDRLKVVFLILSQIFWILINLNFQDKPEVLFAAVDCDKERNPTHFNNLFLFFSKYCT